jgi:hypothetical protein
LITAHLTPLARPGARTGLRILYLTIPLVSEHIKSGLTVKRGGSCPIWSSFRQKLDFPFNFCCLFNWFYPIERHIMSLNWPPNVHDLSCMRYTCLLHNNRVYLLDSKQAQWKIRYSSV